MQVGLGGEVLPRQSNAEAARRVVGAVVWNLHKPLNSSGGLSSYIATLDPSLTWADAERTQRDGWCSCGAPLASCAADRGNFRRWAQKFEEPQSSTAKAMITAALRMPLGTRPTPFVIGRRLRQ